MKIYLTLIALAATCLLISAKSEKPHPDAVIQGKVWTWKDTNGITVFYNRTRVCNEVDYMTNVFENFWFMINHPHNTEACLTITNCGFNSMTPTNVSIRTEKRPIVRQTAKSIWYITFEE